MASIDSKVDAFLELHKKKEPKTRTTFDVEVEAWAVFKTICKNAGTTPSKVLNLMIKDFNLKRAGGG